MIEHNRPFTLGPGFGQIFGSVLGPFALGSGADLPPMPTITPTSGSVNNSDAAGKIVLNLPDLSVNEDRTYVPTVGPAFAIGTAGDLIRGLVSFTGGAYSGKIVQNNGQEVVETPVTITATDVPVILLTQPPSQTADSTPLVVGSVVWNDHTVSGLLVTAKVDTVTNGTTTTNGVGAFSYEITPALTEGQTYTIEVLVDVPGTQSAATTVNVTGYAFVYDPETTTYRYGSTSYATEAEFLTASLGVTDAGIKRIWGPFVEPDAFELVTNGDFSNGTTGWEDRETSAGPSVLSVSSGVGVLTGNGAVNASASQLVPVEKGKFYVGRADVRKDAGATQSPKLIVAPTTHPALSAAIVQSQLVTASTLTAQRLTFGPIGSEIQVYFGVGTNAAGLTGTYGFDNFSVKEGRIFKEVDFGAVSGIVEFTTGSALPTATEVIFQFDDESKIPNSADYNYERLYWSTDGKLRLGSSFQGVRGSPTLAPTLDLGTIAINTRYTVQFLATGGILAAKLGSNTSVQATLTNYPPMGLLRIGRAVLPTTNDFKGTVHKLRLYKAATPPEGVSLSFIQVAGDSYGTSLPVMLSTATGKAVKSIAIGGSTLTRIRDDVLAQAGWAGNTTVIWDGANNEYGTVAAYMAIWQQIKDYIGSTKLIVLPPIKRSSTTSTNADITLIQSQLATMFGANYVDAQGILANHGNGSAEDNAAIAAGYVPDRFLSDNVHLTNEARTFIFNDAGGLLSKPGIMP